MTKKTPAEIWKKFWILLDTRPYHRGACIELIGELDNIFDQLIEANEISEHQRQNAKLMARIKFNEDS